jgi:hypothetical protein
VFDLVRSFGERAQGLLEDTEASNDNDTSIVKGLDATTDTYIKFQKVVCGRNLNSDEAAGSLFGGGAKSE